MLKQKEKGKSWKKEKGNEVLHGITRLALYRAIGEPKLNHDRCSRAPEHSAIIDGVTIFYRRKLINHVFRIPDGVGAASGKI